MAEIFPASLQDKFNQAGFSHEFGDTTIRSSVDAGLDKVRSRYTIGIDNFKGTIDLELDEYNTLSTFYKTTLSNGIKTFYFNHPFTQVQAEFRFLNPPSLAPMGGTYFKVSFSWEEMP